MTPCPEEDQLAAYPEGRLDDAEAEAIERHVADCSRCAAAVGAAAHFTGGVEPEAEPTELGPGGRVARYTVLARVGEGAMGIVYEAYDPQLDRKVALKIVRRASPALMERLLFEAKAMARVESPFVVAVHDSGTYAAGVFIAMDFVAGQTLRAWLAERSRAARDILGAFVQAGRGLAAAHRAGVVHRDFKPDNVLVRPDGRVVVTDFGLARSVEVGKDDADDLDAPLTRTATGAFIGTPAYMAPEQHRGEAVDPRADLFAFCVALGEALYRQHPFAASSLRALRAAVEAGEVRLPAGRDVPRHVRAALLAGLRPDRDERPASMAVLLELLERDVWRAARRIAIAGGALALVAAGLVAGRGGRPEVCTGAEALLAGTWDPPRRAALGAAFAKSGGALGADAVAVVTRQLDAYATSWVQAHTDACTATRVHGVQSESLLDRRMACLDDRRVRLGALERRLEAATADVVEKAPLAVFDLPAIADCADVQHLAAIDPPAPIDAPLVALARVSLARSQALRALGQKEDGLRELAPSLAIATATGYRPLEAEARLEESGLHMGVDDRATEAAARAALAAATAAGRADLAAAALIDLVRALGWGQFKTDAALEWAQLAAATVERADDPLLRGGLLAAVGNVQTKSSHPERAVPLLHVALAVLEAELGPDHPRVALVAGWLAMAIVRTGQAAVALPYFERAYAIRARSLGRDHPQALIAQANLGLALREVGRHDEALVTLTDAVARIERVRGPDHPEISGPLEQLSVVEFDLGRYADAVASQRRSIAIRERVDGPDAPSLITALNKLGDDLAAVGDHEGAVAVTRRSIDIAERRLDPAHPLLRNARQQHAFALKRASRCAEAMPLLRQVVAMYEAHLAEHPDIARSLDGLAGCLLEQHDLAGAEASHARGLAVREKALGRDHPFLTDSLAGLAEVYLARRELARALALVDRTESILTLGGRSYPAQRAETRLLRARILWESDRARARAEATAALASLPSGVGERERARISAWLAAHR